ncbi:MAG: thermonuclease family protein, partial [archaeon]|nr:thermonuclease family protein [archaeon]
MSAKRITIFLLVLITLSLISIYYPTLTGNATKSTEYPLEEAILNRVIDGDTIEVTGPVIGEKTHIRMLGINTPEKKMPFSNESTSFLKQFEGKPIILERDWEDTDKYKRKLRYVFYDNRLINQEILENGFANTYYLS